MLDFLSAALLSAEYDRALSRALAMAECPVVPFFGAFLRELREILSSGSTMPGGTVPGHDSSVPVPSDPHYHYQHTSVGVGTGSGGGVGGFGGGHMIKSPKNDPRIHRDQQQQQRQVVSGT